MRKTEITYNFCDTFSKFPKAILNSSKPVSNDQEELESLLMGKVNLVSLEYCLLSIHLEYRNVRQGRSWAKVPSREIMYRLPKKTEF